MEEEKAFQYCPTKEPPIHNHIVETLLDPELDPDLVCCKTQPIAVMIKFRVHLVLTTST